jgi:2-aminoadipate transaminase
MTADEFMGKYDYSGHLEKIRGIYRRKAELAMNLIDKHLAPAVTYIRPEGGLFIWCALPESVDMPDFCKRAVTEKVAVVPGNAFLVNESAACSSFRINFSMPSERQLEQGIGILGKVLEA